MKDNDTVDNIMDLDMLTPGSVWTRKNGKESRFLFLTNTHLPPHLADKYPQMAVYADENDNMYSIPIADFVGNRTFYNVDPALEARVGNLLAFSAQDADGEFSLEDGDDDELTIDTGSEEEDAGAEDFFGGTPEPEAPARVFPVEFSSGDTNLPVIISAERLQELTESYQQQPHNGQYLHTLFIRAEEGITRESLYACFSPNHVEKNAVYTFKIRTADGVIDIDWDALVGIFPYVFQNMSMYQVIFSTNEEPPIEHAEEDIQFAVNAVDGQVVIAAAEASAPLEVADELVVAAGEPEIDVDFKVE